MKSSKMLSQAFFVVLSLLISSTAFGQCGAGNQCQPSPTAVADPTCAGPGGNNGECIAPGVRRVRPPDVQLIAPLPAVVPNTTVPPIKPVAPAVVQPGIHIPVTPPPAAVVQQPTTVVVQSTRPPAQSFNQGYAAGSAIGSAIQRIRIKNFCSKNPGGGWRFPNGQTATCHQLGY